jgi:hypothetical protein
MKHIHEMLREKQFELARLQKEVEALRLVAGMIGQDSKAEVTDPISLPAAQEILQPPRAVATPLARPAATAPPVAAAPPAPLSIPPAPLNPPPMMMRPPAPAYGEGALASANDALAKRFP